MDAPITPAPSTATWSIGFAMRSTITHRHGARPNATQFGTAMWGNHVRAGTATMTATTAAVITAGGGLETLDHRGRLTQAPGPCSEGSQH